MYRMYRKIPDPFEGDFAFSSKNRYILEEFRSVLWLISWSLPDDEGGITCMPLDFTFLIKLTHFRKWYEECHICT